MADFDKLYVDTEKYIDDLKKNYLNKHIANKMATPDDYNNDVKSFCVLSHAAMEELVETIVLSVMNYAIDEYIRNIKISTSLMALLHFKSNGNDFLSKPEKDNNIVLMTMYDYLKDRLDEIKDKFSKEIFNNHGVSLKYIKKLLMPVSIDITNDANLKNSLSILAEERGSYAHKILEKGSIRKSINPEDAWSLVSDCLLLCLDIKDKAKINVSV